MSIINYSFRPSLYRGCTVPAPTGHFPFYLGSTATGVGGKTVPASGSPGPGPAGVDPVSLDAAATLLKMGRWQLAAQRRARLGLVQCARPAWCHDHRLVFVTRASVDAALEAQRLARRARTEISQK